MKRISVFFLSILIGTLAAGCAGSGAAAAPELARPVGVMLDTEKVTRRNVETIDQYRASVRIETEELFFTEGGMRLETLNLYEGNDFRVSKGDVLAELNTEAIDKQIEEKNKYIESLVREYDHANVIARYDVEIAELRASREPDNEALRINAEKLRLRLSHAMELQEMEIKWQEELLADIVKRLDVTVLTAPFDGRIVFVDYVSPGDWIQPYRPLIYIADESPGGMFVEYTGTESLRVASTARVVGVIDGKEHRLSYEELSREEILSYVFDNRTPPSRFTFVDEPAGVSPGTFISLIITRNSAEGVLTIPVNSLFTAPELGNYVYVVENGQKILRMVKIGLKNPAYVEITEGLEEGEDVFVQQ